MFIVIEIKPGKIQCFDCLQVVPHEMICVSVNHAMSLFIVVWTIVPRKTKLGGARIFLNTLETL